MKPQDTSFGYPFAASTFYKQYSGITSHFFIRKLSLKQLILCIMKSLLAFPGEGRKRGTLGWGYMEDLIESDNMLSWVMAIHEYSLYLFNSKDM